ncbi:MAG: FAD-dependent oxidoreductase [Treponema sp.]|nr:FAD-dependent oxidoreductase [Treponema sp.]
MEGEPDGPDRTVDVVVVGSGIAGSMAALSAREAGAGKVLLIEKRAIFGGTAKLSQGGFATAVVNAKNNPQESLNDWKAWMQDGDSGYPDYDKFLSVAGQAGDAVEYLRSLGLIIIGQVSGGGNALMTKLEETITAQNIEVLLGCEAMEITLDNGVVSGIAAIYRHRSFRIKAKNVMLATGGFSRNPELVAQWAGTNPGLTYVVSLADSGSAGDGILMARRIGAALYSNAFTKIAGLQFSAALRGISAFAQPALLSPAPAPLSTQILVNNEAKRIMDEAIGGSFGNVSSYNSGAAYIMIKDGKPPYYILYDADSGPAGMMDLTASLEAGAALGNGEVLKAQTLNNLAVAMDVPAGTLKDTVTRYNGFADSEDGDFGKHHSYIKRIETPPFYAVKAYPNSYGSMGGVVTDSNGRVFDEAGNVIPHLYAVGEVSNRDFYNESYIGGASLALYSTAGRIAGKATGGK